jgi:NAD(P)-dependent dehydrogenase (short-subunit alcohol dehydrogenase family)
MRMRTGSTTIYCAMNDIIPSQHDSGLARQRPVSNTNSPILRHQEYVYYFSQEGARQSVCDIMPYGRPGEVLDLATPIAFLISEENTYITGTEILVDGGMQHAMPMPDFSKLNMV